jgi:hypothetical protein
MFRLLPVLVRPSCTSQIFTLYSIVRVILNFPSPIENHWITVYISQVTLKTYVYPGLSYQISPLFAICIFHLLIKLLSDSLIKLSISHSHSLSGRGWVSSIKVVELALPCLLRAPHPDLHTFISFISSQKMYKSNFKMHFKFAKNCKFIIFFSFLFIKNAYWGIR